MKTLQSKHLKGRLGPVLVGRVGFFLNFLTPVGHIFSEFSEL